MWLTENVDFPYFPPDPLDPQFAFERLSLSLDTDAFWAGFLTLEHDPAYFLTLRRRRFDHTQEWHRQDGCDRPSGAGCA